MRADRLLSIMLMLQTHGQITARELAERLEVSERTIYRDIDALSAAGVPVYAERGVRGGCMLAEDYRTNLTGLTESEVRSLFMSGLTSPLADLGLSKPMEDAMLKLLAALPSAHRQAAERSRQRIHFDAEGWNHPDETVPHLGTMQTAVWQERRLCLVYRRGEDGKTVERVLDPLGLVAKAGIWYLVAGAGEERRVFRVSRILDTKLLDEHFTYPEDFDLARFWNESSKYFKANLPRYEAKVRIAPAAIPTLPHIFGEGIMRLIAQTGVTDSEGWVTINLTFDSMVIARGRLMGFGNTLEVLEPPELRDSIIQVANNLISFYNKSLVPSP